MVPLWAALGGAGALGAGDAETPGAGAWGWLFAWQALRVRAATARMAMRRMEVSWGLVRTFWCGRFSGVWAGSPARVVRR